MNKPKHRIRESGAQKLIREDEEQRAWNAIIAIWRVPRDIGQWNY